MALLILMSADGEHIRIAVAKDDGEVRRTIASFQTFSPHKVHCAGRIFVRTKEHASRIIKAMEHDPNVERWRVRGKFYRATCADMLAACYLAALEAGIDVFTGDEAQKVTDRETFARMDRAFAA